MIKANAATRAGRLAIGFGLGIAMIAGPGCSSQTNDDTSEATPAATVDSLSTADIMARADAYVASNVLYCQAPAGQYYDGDEACYPGVACPDPSPAKPWHDYRTDCSGFVSYLWQLPDDPDTATFVSDRSGPQGWTTVALDQMQAGDAFVADGHIKLFSHYVSNGSESGSAYIYEEYNCKELARKDTQYFTKIGNNEILFDRDNRPYHPIRRNALTPSPKPIVDVHEVAFQANTGSLWTVGSVGEKDWKLGMHAGTSPSIAALKGGGYIAAFEANTSSLWTASSNGSVRNWHLGMKAGTSPSITALEGGGYEIAFQANDGSLWTVGDAEDRNWKLGLSPYSSPAIVGLSGGGYEVAFQANNGVLWTVGTALDRDWKLGMREGSSPAIAAFPNNGFEVAFEANNDDLWTVGTVEDKHWDLGMASGTSPSIVALAGNKYQVAFEANTGALWTAGSGNIIKDWKLGMRAGSSPSIAAAAGGGFDVDFEANTGVLWQASSANGAGRSLSRGMKLGTSPSGT